MNLLEPTRERETEPSGGARCCQYDGARSDPDGVKGAILRNESGVVLGCDWPSFRAARQSLLARHFRRWIHRSTLHAVRRCRFSRTRVRPDERPRASHGRNGGTLPGRVEIGLSAIASESTTLSAAVFGGVEYRRVPNCVRSTEGHARFAADRNRNHSRLGSSQPEWIERALSAVRPRETLPRTSGNGLRVTSVTITAFALPTHN